MGASPPELWSEEEVLVAVRLDPADDNTLKLTVDCLPNK